MSFTLHILDLRQTYLIYQTINGRGTYLIYLTAYCNCYGFAKGLLTIYESIYSKQEWNF